jgi:hypothetical protein
MPKRQKKTRFARYALNGKRQLKSVLFDKKAVSVVVSTIVLTAGVLAMGIAILYWAYSWGRLATHSYSITEETNAKAVQERLGFEYIDYSGGTLTVNIMNWGGSGNVTIASVYLYDNTHQYVANYTRPTVRNITNNAVVQFGLPVGGEGYFALTPSPALFSGRLYYIRLITDRGRTFDGSFVTP